MTLHLAGKTFNYLTVIKRIGRTKLGKTIWECNCICGKTTTKITNEIVSGKVKTCGCCEWQIRHNECYNSWQAARQRCTNINNKDYPSYGGRGISMCKEWDDFIQFYLVMGDPPTDKFTGERLSIDRIDVNGNYEPSNCKWATRTEQQYNRR